jgi:hypothetical protein
MISFKRFLEEQKQGHAHYVDVDDTLYHTTAKIGVRDPSGKVVKRLSNSEYNTHDLPKGHSYDYSEFKDADKFSRESKPIPRMIHKVNKIQRNIGRHPNSKVHLLTARADFDDKHKFLDTFRRQGMDMDNIHVHRVGNIPGNEHPAAKKARVISDHIKKHGYKKVSMYDDSKANLQALLNMRKEHPDVHFTAFHVGPDGNMTHYKGE